MQGCADLPLCEKGRAAAATDCAKLGAIHLTLVLSGPDEACRSTASLVAVATGKGKVKSVDGLRELGLGLWEGQREEELELRYASAYRAWRHDPAKVVPPEGESMIEAQDRLMEQVVKGIGRRRGPEGVGIVLRPFAMALVRSRIFGLPLDQVWQILETSPCTEWISLDMTELKQGRSAASTIFAATGRTASIPR
jgi:broad specificity phosphatase PhoE